jgi:hypothetical protein
MGGGLFCHINTFFIDKIEYYSTLFTQTNLFIMRCGSIVSVVPHDSTDVRVAKVIQSVKRLNPHTSENETVNVIKLHYNGQLFLVPDSLLRPSTPEEKKKDPKNMAYWKHIPDKTSLKDIVWTDTSEYYYL